uniref:phosphoacetylglucosamine mutase n=1 Tax=Ciona intestinalis TaxID=7719 RepID=UPI000180B33F|nr:phosphoacetylglucosamine mutase [Ciona intestinalis]|eukprot:XP_002119184.1 phosphoacetylglucosamine mutase [Ciona intestinalis]
MATLNEIPILKLAEVHAKPKGHQMSYGTAGFRGNASGMDHVFFRMGMLAVLRSKLMKATIGVMVTASHNPEHDNGVKLIDPHGEMLTQSWEELATSLANVTNDELIKEMKKIVDSQNIQLSNEASVFIARDTRPSSLALSQAVLDGATALGATCTNYGLLTTPQLHHIVACYNGGNHNVNEEQYYQHYANAFKALLNEKPVGSSVTVDCANGVGAPKLVKLAEHIGVNIIDIVVHNNGQSGKLNENCGADYVKVQQRAPVGLNMEPDHRYASFDGDADRLVYYTLDSDCNFVLLDGDKIAALFAVYIKELLNKADINVRLGVVQTAYANGSSTNYISTEENIEVACAQTGVKHLHKVATAFDIGVYFEANGHGTVTVKDDCLNKIRSAATSEEKLQEQKLAANKLTAFLDVVNQTVGDAMSDLLAVEAILQDKGWSIRDWSCIYTELPNRQAKVKVADRTVIETTDAERKVTKPPALQPAIDKVVAEYPCGRSFVRPSGTEDVVRVYAESDTQENTDKLAKRVSLLVYELAGGVGEKPQ